MAQSTTAKVTISLRKELLEVADRLARERDTTRSGVIADLLEKEEKARIYALMEEGYKEMAEENQRLAAESFPYAQDMIFNNTVWEEGPVDKTR
ncbi:MAG: CopG family transcriptional regulator [SAR202 cluster bacterium]|nr:CopG family transcriptional regulator [SAR202 cluster bacterium]